MVISIEVIERGRPAALSWVQEMIAKHRGLPTNRLVLVSKSGFTRNALAAVGREAGRVQALRPELIMVGAPATGLSVGDARPARARQSRSAPAGS